MAGELRMHDRPKLDRPVLIGAFRGWNDGGQAATLATGYLARLWGAEKFADIDPELFVDFQATRPHVSLDEGETRRIEWPENTFFRARVPGTNRDAVVLVGVEPNYRWRTFTDLVADLAHDLGVELVVTLGALLADVPHTRPAPVTGRSNRPEARRRARAPALPLRRADRHRRVLLDACRRAGIPSVSLWAAVPHYVSLAPSPRAARALCERLATVLGIEIDVSELSEAESSYVEQVSQAVASDAETAAYVEELEQRADSLDWLEESGELPSGEALAAEIARFLRERERNGGEQPGCGRRPRLSAEAGALGRVFGRLAELRQCRLPARGRGRAAPLLLLRPAARRPARRLRRSRPAAPCGPFRFRRRLRDLRAVSFGAGRLSASAFAISSIVPISSRARSSDALARGV